MHHHALGVDIQLDHPLPQIILAHRPLYLLGLLLQTYQVDQEVTRVNRRANQVDPYPVDTQSHPAPAHSSRLLHLASLCNHLLEGSQVPALLTQNLHLPRHSVLHLRPRNQRGHRPVILQDLMDTLVGPLVRPGIQNLPRNPHSVHLQLQASHQGPPGDTRVQVEACLPIIHLRLAPQYPQASLRDPLEDSLAQVEARHPINLLRLVPHRLPAGQKGPLKDTRAQAVVRRHITPRDPLVQLVPRGKDPHRLLLPVTRHYLSHRPSGRRPLRTNQENLQAIRVDQRHLTFTHSHLHPLRSAPHQRLLNLVNIPEHTLVAPRLQ